MSLSDDELKLHCSRILADSRINNKIIILCEGRIRDHQGTLSPQSFKQTENFQDAVFYRACIPSFWRESIPRFFNCGDRSDVLNTYSSLLKMIKDESTNLDKYHPKDIYAIVDLDIQNQNINNYHFPDVHSIFMNLYERTKVNESNANGHKIWVTGFIYKEAYFLVPKLLEIFEKFLIQPISLNSKFILEEIHLKMSKEMSEYKNLKANFNTACSFVNHCTELDFSGVDQLRDSWINEFENALNSQRKEELIFILLCITNAKEYWKQIEPTDKWTGDSLNFREEISRAIAKDFYAKLLDSEAIQYHIPYFIKMLSGSSSQI